MRSTDRHLRGGARCAARSLGPVGAFTESRGPGAERALETARALVWAILSALAGVSLLPAAIRGQEAGYLDLLPAPGQVILDGSPLEVPGRTLVALAAGAHVIEFLPAATSARWEPPVVPHSFSVAAAETVRLDLAQRSPLTVTSRPAGAQVLLAGRLLGLTPLRLSFLSTPASPILFHLARHAEVALSVTLEDLRAGALSVDLSPEAAPPAARLAAARTPALLRYGAIAGGVASVAAGFIIKGRANDLYDLYLRTGQPAERERLYAEALRRDDRARLAWAGGEALLATALYLFARDLLRDRRVVLEASVGARGEVRCALRYAARR